MPYIKCPDGKTYSRYNQSKYVKWCISNKKEQQQKKFNECMQDPTCKKEYLQGEELARDMVIYGGSIFFVLVAFLLCRELKVQFFSKKKDNESKHIHKED